MAHRMYIALTSLHCSPPSQYLVLLLAVLCLHDILAIFIPPYFTKVGGRKESEEERSGRRLRFVQPYKILGFQLLSPVAIIDCLLLHPNT